MYTSKHVAATYNMKGISNKRKNPSEQRKKLAQINNNFYN